MTPQSMKRMYGHALTGMARELKPMKTWPSMSEGGLTALSEVIHFLNSAAELLAGNSEALDELDYVCSRLGDLTYRNLPGRGDEMIQDTLEEVLHIRMELGYM